MLWPALDLVASESLLLYIFGSKLAWSCKLVIYMIVHVAIVLISCVIAWYRRLHVLLGVKMWWFSMSLECA